jgi:hypothetical protein
VKVEINDAVLATAIADNISENLLQSEALIERIADTIVRRFELLTPAEAAFVIGNISKRTLTENHVSWGLDKSVAFGLSNPRYLLSQILHRASEKVIKGRSAKEG